MKRIGIVAEVAVLTVLAPGGMLTVAQLMQQAQLTSWSTRGAVSRLAAQGLIVDSHHRGRWSITDRGKRLLVSRGARFAL